METGDLKRAIGGYLLSRAAGASHQGAMGYAGQMTYRGIERRENQEIREKERDELWARQDEKEAARIARADRIRAENLANTNANADRSFRESNYGKFTNESINAYLDGGRTDTSLLVPIEGKEDESAQAKALLDLSDDWVDDVKVQLPEDMKGQAPVITALSTQYAVNELGIDLTNPKVAANYQAAFFSATSQMAAALQRGEKVNSAAPYFKRSIMTTGCLLYTSPSPRDS